ncbi:hypothetical protein [Sphingobacterium kitahiroshimense]|uniref:Uncharacterized protein n=1 Tax=Sphingobacterium kitahiroshimense TaxID=470446 RepID=A0ABV0BTX9_9SPHI
MNIVGAIEFLVANNEPMILEIDPRISRVSKLSYAAGGANVYRELTHLAITKRFRNSEVSTTGKCAIQMPLVILPTEEMLTKLHIDAQISMVKPIDWMPFLPLKGNIILVAETLVSLKNKVQKIAQFSNERYVEEAMRSIEISDQGSEINNSFEHKTNLKSCL